MLAEKLRVRARSSRHRTERQVRCGIEKTQIDHEEARRGSDSVLPRTGWKGGQEMRRCALAERENYVWVIYKYICM